MSLLWVESYDAGADAAILTKYVGSAASAFATTGRNGSGFTFNGANPLITPDLSIGSNSGFFGSAFRIGNAPGADNFLFGFSESANAVMHVAVYMTTSRTLKVVRGANSATLATGSTVLATNAWYYIELEMKCHDSTGLFELRIDGVTEVSGTGVDTRNGGTGTIAAAVWGSTGANQIWDDTYVCNDQGSFNNDFRGNCIVEHRLAQTGNGGNTDFTTSTGSDHGALVDESAPNGDTDYNFSATVNHIDTYNIADLTLSGSVLGVVVNNYCRKTDVGARTVNGVARISGSNYVSSTPDQSLTTTYGLKVSIFETDPSTSAAWASQAAVNAAEFGVKVMS